MARPLSDLPLGVYVHVPWCRHLCPYCDFAVVVRPAIDHEGYLRAILAELEARAGDYPGRRLRSIYFGGGTPGLWEPLCIARVISAIRERWAGEDLEITVEHNPEVVTTEGASRLVEAGVGRISLGVQSFDAATLASLGRRHTAEDARRAVAAIAAAGIKRISLDLIFGAPGQDLPRWEADLRAATALEAVGHLSLYQLTIEPRTVFGRQVARGRQRPPEDELCAELYDRACAHLGGRGFDHYEVSSWALPDQRSRHNGLYWIGAEYLGLGVGAHSLAFSPQGATLRRGNTRSLRTYLADPAGAAAEVEAVDERTHLAERLMTGLRTAAGVDWSALAACLDLDVDAAVGEEVAALVEEGLLRWEGGWLRPTPRGLALGDRVAERLLP